MFVCSNRGHRTFGLKHNCKKIIIKKNIDDSIVDNLYCWGFVNGKLDFRINCISIMIANGNTSTYLKKKEFISEP